MHNTRTVLVTGAMGQLGKHVTRMLLTGGHRVIALDLDNKATRAAVATLQAEPGAPGSLAPDFINLVDTEAVHAVVTQRQPDVIVHLAAIVSPPCYKNPTFARQVNVEGTRNLVHAALQLKNPPLFVEASSSSVYGSRNPHRYPDRANARTPVNPIECYGADKVIAETIVSSSGLPHAILRLGGIISPDDMGKASPDYFLLMRATPRDNRIHAVDVRDTALAFANTVDDRGWGLTDWSDTTEAQQLLSFQQYNWCQTLEWLTSQQGPGRYALRIFSPLLRSTLRTILSIQRKLERRGPYADPWTLISRKYGDQILVPTSF